MDGPAMTRHWSVHIPQPLYDRLHGHLFPGDGDEHGAVLTAGICETKRGVRLLVREVFLARDGVDYVPGTRGYRALTARFVAEVIGHCAEEQLCYLAAHNHGGRGVVSFSGDDLASHERGYPALLDITNGGPIGALVVAEDAIAGDIWLPGNERRVVAETVIVGPQLRRVYPSPSIADMTVDRMYDRHARLFGDIGQHRLRQLKIGVIGAGGVGSLIVQLLARLGVGHVVVIDPDRVDLTNLPRLPGATRWDARACLTERDNLLLQRLGKRFARHKVHVAERVAREAQPKIRVDAIVGDIVDPQVAAVLVDADVLFLAADTMQARRVFNALVHQYLIPGFQIGSKVRVTPHTGQVDEIFSVVRPILPHAGGGCLLCNGLIPPGRLNEEALSERERRAQRYVENDEIYQPSVITLNAIGASLAANDMLLMVTGLFDGGTALEYLRHDSRARSIESMGMRSSQSNCRDCGTGQRSRLGRGDRARLPCKMPSETQRRFPRLLRRLSSSNTTRS